MNKQQMAVAGAIALILGVFMPILSVPIAGTVSYFANGKGDGVIVLLIGLGTLLVAMKKEYRALPWLGAASLLVLGFTFIRIQSRMSEMRETMNRELIGNPFRGLADGMVNAVQIQWGFGVLLLGAVLVLIAAGIKEPANQ